MGDHPQKITGVVKVEHADGANLVGVQINYGPSSEQLHEEIRSAVNEGFCRARSTDQSGYLSLAPPLPSLFVVRSVLTELLITEVLGSRPPGVMRLVTLQGLGGSGKSTLAKALCYADAVRESFDGILWAELSGDAGPTESLTRWVRALGEPDFQPRSLAEASDRLRIRLSGRRMLLVLDNVWHADDVRPFLVSPDCFVLLTTRRAAIADDLGSRLIEIPPMDDPEAIALLEHWLGRSIRPEELDAATKLIEEVDRLPLALELAGALLARACDWARTRLAFKTEANSLITTQQMSRQLARIVGCISISVRQLRVHDETAWRRFLELGLVARGTTITPSIAATFWDTSATDALVSLQNLQDEALIRNVGDGWSFHDLVQDVALRAVSDPHGLALTIDRAHHVFLARCGWSLSDGASSQLRDDGYTMTHLTWHLEQAREFAEIHRLLWQPTDSQQCAWWELLDSRNEAGTFLADIDRATRLAMSEPNPFVLLFRYTAVHTSLVTMVQRIAPVVLRSMVENGHWDLPQGYGIARQILDPENAAQMFADLAELSADRSDNNLTALMLAAAEDMLPRMKSAWTRGSLAARLCHRASGSQRARLVSLAKQSCADLTDWPSSVAEIIFMLPGEEQRGAIESCSGKLSDDGCKLAKELSRRVLHLPSLQRSGWIEFLRQWCGQQIAQMERSAEAAPGKPGVVAGLLSSLAESLPRPGHGEPKASSGRVKKRSKKSENVPGVTLALGHPSQNTSSRPDSDGGSKESHAESKDPRADLEEVLMILIRAGILDVDSVRDQIVTIPHRAELLRPDLVQTIEARLASIKNYDLADQRLEALLALVGSIPESLKEEAGRVAAESLKAVWEGSNAYGVPDAVQVFVRLRELLPQQEVPDILDALEAGAYAAEREDAGWRLARVSSLLESTKHRAMSEARRRFLEAQPSHYKDRAMAAFASVLSYRDLHALLKNYQNIGDGESRARLRFSVAPYLRTGDVLDDLVAQSANQRLQTLAKIMQGLVETFTEPQLRSFITAAVDLAADWWVIEALSDVLLRIDDEEAILRVLRVSRGIGPADLRSRLANRVVHRLADLGRIDSAIVTTSQIDLASEKWAGMADSVERLAIAGKFSEASLIAQEIVDSEERGRAEASILLHKARLGKVEEARGGLARITSAKWREWASGRLALLVGPNDVEAAVSSIVPSGIRPAVETTPKYNIQSWVATLDSDSPTAHAWRSLASHLEAPGQFPSLQEFWRHKAASDFLKQFEGMPRASFWLEMRHLVPIMAESGETDDLRGMDRSTREVGMYWP